MKSYYNMHEAKTHLSQLVEEAATGEEVIIAKSGKPVARLVAYAQQPRREPGRYRDDIRMDESFHEPLPESEQQAWEGRTA